MFHWQGCWGWTTSRFVIRVKCSKVLRGLRNLACFQKLLRCLSSNYNKTSISKSLLKMGHRLPSYLGPDLEKYLGIAMLSETELI